MSEKYEKFEGIVLDGANVIHDDSGIHKKDSEGNNIIQIWPERLRKAISNCEKRGWPTTAFLKEGTYLHAVRMSEQESPYMGDLDILDRLIADNKVSLINSRKEDIYWIEYALQTNALIVTNDRFRTEEERFPHLDWDAINERTIRGHKFVGDEFILPGLTKKHISVDNETELVSIEVFNKLKHEVDELKKQIQTLTHTELKRIVVNPTSNERISINREIMEVTIAQSLSEGKRVEIGHFHRLIASAVLGLDITGYPHKWPKTWSNDLNDKLNFVVKKGKKGHSFYDELKKNSQRDIIIAPARNKKTTKEVSLSPSNP